MIFGIRDAKPSDLVHLQDCDVKCFDWVWTPEEWTHAFDNYVVKVAHYYGTPIGFAVFVALNQNPRIVYLFKLGVKTNFRRRGAGRLLVVNAMDFAAGQGIHEIESIVPETLCRPGEPQNITDWLAKVGLKGAGVVPKYISSMGVVEDGYRFNMRF